MTSRLVAFSTEEIMARKTVCVLVAGVALALAGLSTATAAPTFVVPDRIYAAVDHECNVYFGNVFDSATPWAYAYEALCDKGRHELKRWCWTPKAEDAGKVRRDVNALHLDDEGGWQVADAVTAFVLGHWAEY